MVELNFLLYYLIIVILQYEESFQVALLHYRRLMTFFFYSTQKRNFQQLQKDHQKNHKLPFIYLYVSFGLINCGIIHYFCGNHMFSQLNNNSARVVPSSILLLFIFSIYTSGNFIEKYEFPGTIRLNRTRCQFSKTIA